MGGGVLENGSHIAAPHTSSVPVLSWAIALAVFWTGVAGVSLVWNITQVRELVLEQAQIESRANFFKDLTFRNWATQHGGVYVPVTPETTPDPYVAYLPERDVRTPSGRLLTLINPALMVRQFNELANKNEGAQGHLSGLNPINPLNQPDAWEARALVQFSQGVEEVTGISELEGKPYLRLIRPMNMGQKCLPCHVQQGYKEGDLAGGVSVSVPLAPLHAAADRRISGLALGHGVLWLFGVIGIGVSARQLRRRIDERKAAADKIDQDFHTQRAMAELLETAMRPDPFEQRLQHALELILSAPRLALKGSGSIFLADPESGNLRMAAMHGLPAQVEQACAMVEKGHCLCGRVAETRELLFVDRVDERHEVHFPGMSPHGHYCAPILFDGALLGVLNLYVDAHHQQTPEEVQFITAAAHALSGMIQRHQAEQQLRYRAYHDDLTGMPNRILFMDRLGQCLSFSERHPALRCAVLYMDIDRFKTINDSLGHTLGDQLLLEVSERVRVCTRPGDTVARMGGDEFTILLEDVSEPADVLRVSDRLHIALQPPIMLEGREIFVSSSIGIAISVRGGRHASDLLRDADTAMYRAKSQGTGQTVLFDEGMHLNAVAQLTLESELRRAVERAELRVHYQPIVEASNGEVLGFEALVRWEHPERGLVPPLEFIPLAEETGLINDIGQWVLTEACRQLQEWRLRFPERPDLYMSINLSARQFLQPDLVERIEAAIAAAGVEPRYIALEITESVLLHNPETANKTLLELKARGLHLYVDDFGTGYSSLSYLQNFPFDALKIDRAFVSRLTPGIEEAEMVSAIIAIARNFNMSVIAEGVENVGQLERLIALGCRKIQGYHFSQPLPADAAGAFVQASDVPSGGQ